MPIVESTEPDIGLGVQTRGVRGLSQRNFLLYVINFPINGYKICRFPLNNIYSSTSNTVRKRQKPGNKIMFNPSVGNTMVTILIIK